jgi:hypothetical protein
LVDFDRFCHLLDLTTDSILPAWHIVFLTHSDCVLPSFVKPWDTETLKRPVASELVDAILTDSTYRKFMSEVKRIRE